MPERSPPLTRRILYYSIIAVLLLLIIELFSRAYYYHQLGLHPLAMVQIVKGARDRLQDHLVSDSSVQRVQNGQNPIRPGFSKAEIDEIVRDMDDANRAVYQPWVEFGFRDIRSRYVNVSDHVRRSVPDLSVSLSKQPFRIFFLGGSTTY